jgi:hypothetical protein
MSVFTLGGNNHNSILPLSAICVINAHLSSPSCTLILVDLFAHMGTTTEKKQPLLPRLEMHSICIVPTSSTQMLEKDHLELFEVHSRIEVESTLPPQHYLVAILS